MPTVKAARSAAKIQKPAAAVLASIPVPKLDKGELWAGLAFVDRVPSHNLIVMPGEARKTFDEYSDWAKSQGGVVIRRAEQALAFANIPHAFKKERYWSGEQTAGDPLWAWYQWFYDGSQHYGTKDNELLVRAVRRDPI